MIYKIQNSNVYLIGSIHLVPKPYILSLDSEYTILDMVDEVVFESDQENPPQPICHQFETQSLKDVIDNELYDKVTSLAKEVGFNGSVDITKPWFLGLVLSILIQHRSGVTGSIDKELWDYAKSKNKKISVLEGTELFVSIDECPIKEHIRALQQLVNNPSQPINQLKSMYQARLDSDLESINNSLSEMSPIMPTFYRCLFDDRNRRWVPSIIAAIQKSKAVAFVVGCGHISYGEMSLRNLLSSSGYLLEPDK